MSKSYTYHIHQSCLYSAWKLLPMNFNYGIFSCEWMVKGLLISPVLSNTRDVQSSCPQKGRQPFHGTVQDHTGKLPAWLGVGSAADFWPFWHTTAIWIWPWTLQNEGNEESSVVLCNKRYQEILVGKETHGNVWKKCGPHMKSQHAPTITDF